MVITITKSGYIKSLPLATYRQQHRGGRGVTGMDMKDGDYIEHLFVCSSHDYLLFFSNRGKVYRSKVYELPEASRTAKGRALVNVLPLREGERIQSVLSTRDFTEGQYLVFATRKRRRQEDRVPRLQHADQGRRHHRDQHPRRRRARRRAADERRRRHPHGLAQGPGRPLPRGRRAVDGPRHLRRARHERQRHGRRRARDGRRARRPGAARRHRERLRQAHADRPSTARRTAARRASARSSSPRRKGALAGALVVREHEELVFISRERHGPAHRRGAFRGHVVRDEAVGRQHSREHDL